MTTPIERIERPVVRGPATFRGTVSVQSAASFDSTVTISGALTAAAGVLLTQGVYGGTTTIGSGVASVVVSTSGVSSGDLVFAQALSNTRQSSGVSNSPEISSVVDGTSFTVGWADGQTVDTRDTVIMWAVFPSGA